MMMKTALLTGATGQDAWHLAKLLQGKGYKVVGCTRSAQPVTPALHHGDQSFELVKWDMRDSAQIRDVLRRVMPTEIYNLAAYSSGAGMYDDPIGISEINGMGVTRILEAIRTIDINMRFCQASSREVFGEALETPQTESTPFNPRSPYGAAKLYADHMIRIYRKRYGLHACSAILFNHESPRRGLEFVTRKITHEAARIKLGQAHELHLGNIETERDWGFAGDYVRAMWLMLQQPMPDDYVIATGKTHTVREFCDVAFARLGLDYRDHVRTDPTAFRPSEPAPLVGSSAKAQRELGWEPEISFRELVHMMVDADLQNLSQLNQQAGKK